MRARVAQSLQTGNVLYTRASSMSKKILFLRTSMLSWISSSASAEKSWQRRLRWQTRKGWCALQYEPALCLYSL